MNPYRHEFWHLLRARALVAVVVIAVLAGLITYDSVNTTSAGLTETGFYYESGSTFHFELWSLDIAGGPVANAQVSLNVSEEFGGNGTLPPRDAFSESQLSDADGRVEFVIPDELSSNASYVANLTFVGPHLSSTTEFQIANQSSDLPVALFTPFFSAAQGFYSTSDRLGVVWAGPGGAPPSGDQVVGCDVPSSYNSYFSPASNCSGAPETFVVGPLTGYLTFLALPPALPNGNSTAYWSQILNIVTVSGSVVASLVSAGSCAPWTCGAVSSPGPSILSVFTAGLGLVLPLTALMLAYWAYAGPRLRGSQDAVLARPVTRRGLFLVRFGTVALAMVVAALGEVLVLDADVGGVLHEPLPVGYVVALAGGLTVAALAVVGLVFLTAHLLRSSTAVLGIGLGFVLVTSIFWGVLVSIAWGAFGASTDPTGYTTFAFRSQLLVPSQIPNLIAALLTGFGPAGPAGVTAGVTALAGGVWVAIPFLLAFQRAVSRD